MHAIRKPQHGTRKMILDAGAVSVRLSSERTSRPIPIFYTTANLCSPIQNRPRLMSPKNESAQMTKIHHPAILTGYYTS